MIDLDDIRGKLAAKYNFVFGKDDPSLATVALFEAALEQSLADLNAQQKANFKEMANVALKVAAELRASSKSIVEQGTEHACDQISTAITATMDEGREQLRKDIRLAWVKIDEARKAAVFAAVASGIAAVLAFAAAFNVI